MREEQKDTKIQHLKSCTPLLSPMCDYFHSLWFQLLFSNSPQQFGSTPLAFLGNCQYADLSVVMNCRFPTRVICILILSIIVYPSPPNCNITDTSPVVVGLITYPKIYHYNTWLYIRYSADMVFKYSDNICDSIAKFSPKLIFPNFHLFQFRKPS